MALKGSNKGIIVSIGTEYTDKDLKRAQADLNKLSATAKQSSGPLNKLGGSISSTLGVSMKSLATGAVAAGAAVAALAVTMAVDGIQAAAAEEQQLARLKNALDNVNQGFALPGINEAIDKMMFATNVADDELRPAFQTLVTATKDAASAQDLLGLAVDISVAKQKDLGSVALALAKASNGQASALTRLGVPLSDGAKKAGNFSLAVGELTTAFGGAAAANADTFAGRIQGISIAFDEAKEAFGTGFLTGFESGLSGLDAMQNGLVDMQPVFEDLGKNVGILAAEIVNLIKPIMDVRDALGPFEQFFNPIKNLSNQFEFFGLALGTVKDQLSFDLPQATKLSEAELSALIHTDWSVLMGNIHAVEGSLDDATKDRVANIFLELHGGRAMGVGIDQNINSILQRFYAAQDEAQAAASSAGSAPALPPNFFKEYITSLTSEAAKVTQRSKLIARGIPAAMAEGILSDPNWQEIVKGLMSKGSDAIKGYVKAFKDSPAGLSIIQDRVKDIVEDARKTLEKLKEQRDTFSKLREDFAKTATDFGSVTTLQTQGPVTAEGITANLRQRLQIVKQFSAALTKLQGAGLGPNALTDIIGLGPFEGLQYANAILAGGATTINDIKNISGQFQQPANIIGNIGAESVSGTTAAALDQSTNFKIDAGAIQITINGEITGETTQQIRNAVTAAFRDVGKEQRNRGKVGVR
jgi:archaellum component FlaC